MALTPEVIKANEVLTGLSEDQITAIATMSANDETTVINTKVGEIHGRYEEDIKAVAGVEKNQGEKSYDYMKRVIGDYKTKVEGSSGLQTQIDSYKSEIQTLKGQIAANSGDETLKTQLKDTQSKLELLQTQYNTDKEQWGTSKKEFESQITKIQVDTEFSKALSGIKFKTGYSDTIQKTLISSAKDGILGKYQPDWVEANGEKVMVFRDSKGEIVRNKANSLEPYTAEELVKESLKDALDLGTTKTGTGTSDKRGQNVIEVELADISSAKTQVEADDLIVKHLMQLGVTRGTAEFAEKQTKIRNDLQVGKLPLK